MGTILNTKIFVILLKSCVFAISADPTVLLRGSGLCGSHWVHVEACFAQPRCVLVQQGPVCSFQRSLLREAVQGKVVQVSNTMQAVGGTYVM